MLSQDILRKFKEYPLHIFVREGFKELVRFLRFRALRQTYSQAGEDRAIMEHLKVRGQLPPHGVYVDVGAHEPVHFNNTYLFYLNGWRGVNIEPNSSLCNKFNTIRPEDRNINCGVWSSQGERLFYEMYPSNQSTFVESMSEAAKNDGAYLVKKVQLPIRTLNDILSQAGMEEIDFLTIDVQGAETEVLAGFDINKYRPILVCIEATVDEKKIVDYLEQHGYACVWKGELSSVWKRVKQGGQT
jgi:FkbM family methyltransferase